MMSIEADMVMSGGLAISEFATVRPAHSQQRLLSKIMPAPIHNNDEQYYSPQTNGVQLTLSQPLSTFSIDVDTASYANVRRMLNAGQLPPADAVRVEEFINYFDYQYQGEQFTDSPFQVLTDVTTSATSPGKHILRVALNAKPSEPMTRPDANLVFLLDVSGSMNSPDKLPLLTKSLKMLTNQLTEDDSVAIVVYAGASGVVLEPTSGANKIAIKQALSQLQAGGSTNGGAGIELAYQLAQKHFKEQGLNRVILATDGDFNVGKVDHEQLVELVSEKRKTGISLSVLSFGTGNLNDHLTEQLANNGNGNAAYIDSISEARKVLVDEMQATLQTVAKDVKIQVEFNPNNVAEYRLIGYENRALKNEDFNNDKVDAGEIGAGHTVTAFYEITLTSSDSRSIDSLRYQDKASSEPNALASLNEELAMVKLRYKPVDGDTSQLLSKVVKTSDIVDFSKASDDFQFASAVSGFAEIVRGSDYWQHSDLEWVIATASKTKGNDPFGYRNEFVRLVRDYQSLKGTE
ncbi:MAG: DUF3520 domain-containing protein [Alteromonadaceae bacterium]|nr:DUF3520 domain-containing protein [Alteromonadaceae bacterium]